jgi:PAS domain S-box-containing protein/putative nucleotidyltransferase with HDIG domain
VSIYFKDLQGRFMKVSKSLATKYGVERPEAILGKTDFDFFDKKIAQDFYTQEQEVLRSAAARLDIDKKETWPDRSVTWANMSLIPLRDKQGETVGTIGISKDITERKISEEALKEAETRYRVLVEKIPAAVYVDFLEEKHPAIYYISPQIEKITGYPPDEWVKNPRLWFEILHPQDRQRMLKENKRTNLTKDPFSMEYRMIARDGRVVWVRDEAVPLYDENGSTKYWQGFLLDITERKQTEEEQARLIERVSGHERVIAHLATREDEPGTDLYEAARSITSKVSEVTGIARVSVWRLNEDRSELHCLDLYEKSMQRHSANLVLKAAEYPAYFKALASGRAIDAPDAASDPRTREFQLSYLQPFGITSRLDAVIRIAGKVVGVVCLEEVGQSHNWAADEVTFAGELADQVAQVFLNFERRKTEMALHESQTMLRIILDTIPVRVFWKDQNSRYLGCNQPFANDAGLESPQAIIGTDDTQMNWREQAESYREDDRAVMETGVPKLNYEEPQTTPQGNQIWLRTSKVPLLDADGKVKGVLGTYEDITDRKLTVRALRESEEKFRSIIEQASEGFALVDEQGILIEWNQALESIWGVKREQVIGRPFWEVQIEATIPEKRTPDRLEYFKNSIKEALQSGQSSMFNHPIETGLYRADGEIRYIEQTIFAVKTYQGYRIASLSRDVTARKQADTALQRQLKELTILHTVALASAQADSGDELIRQVTSTIGKALSLDHIGVHLLTKNEIFWDQHLIYGNNEESLSPKNVPLSSGIFGRVLRTGLPARIGNVRNDPDYFEVDPRTRSELCLPIQIGGSIIGIMNAESSQLDFFGTEDEQLLTTVAGSLAIAIEKLRLYEAERTRRQEAETLRQAAAAVASSIELRQVLEMILISLKQVVPYDSATVILLEGDRLRLTAVQGFAHPDEVLNLTFSADDKLFSESRTTRKPVILADARQDARFNRWPGSEHVRGWMGVPLIFRDSVIGYITIDSRKPDVYDAESADLALAFTQQAAVAIENARLYEQAIKAVERRAILHEAGQEIARASQEPQRVYETVHHATGQMMPAEAFVIALLEADQQKISLVYLVDKGGSWPVTSTAPGVGLTGRVIETGSPVIIRDLNVEPVADAIHFGEDEEVRSILAVPIRLGGKVIGMLSTQSYHPYAYTEDDQAMLEMLAAHAAIAIENSRLYVETRHRLTEMEAVSRISTALRTAQTVEDMLPILLDETLRAVETDSGALDIFDASTGMLKPVVTRGWFSEIAEEPVSPSAGITGTVFTTGQPILTDDFAADPRTSVKVHDLIPPGWSGAAIPIRTLQETIGVMFVSLKAPRKLQPDELHLLATISEIAGNALHRADLHQQTERQVQRLASLRAIDSAISTILDLRVTLGVLIDHIITQLHVDAVDVLLLNTNTQALDHAASTGFRGEAIKQIHQYIGEGLAGQAIRSRGLVYIPNLLQTTQDLKRQFLTGEGFVTYVGIPLIAKGQVKGVLEVYTRTPLEPDADWRSFFETLAGETAIAIENASLFEELQRTNLDLSLAYDATIEGWSKALDLRDQETEGHTLRVTEKTLQLARRIGVSDIDLVHIRRGSLLHDIGKMGVPDSILHKTGALTLDEWEIMHRHPTLAYEMLSPITYLSHAIDIPYCHHENWSGTGYPRGLKSEQIPLPARIFAVVDVWDALTSDRPYRKAWTRKAAYDYIQKNSAILFDPTVVEKFLKMLNEE